MKYYCNVNDKKTVSKLEAIKLQYPRAVILESIEDLLKVIKPGDEVVFDNVLELVPSGDEYQICKQYISLYNQEIDLMFDRSPNCDSMVISYYVSLMMPEWESSEADLFERILRMQIESYVNIKDALANSRKYSQLSANRIEGKSYGRPKGSTRDSEKAKATKAFILANNKDFNGTLSDAECIKLTQTARNTYYRYKRYLKLLQIADKNNTEQEGDKENADIQ